MKCRRERKRPRPILVSFAIGKTAGQNATLTSG